MSEQRNGEVEQAKAQDEVATNKRSCYFYIVIPPEDTAVSQDVSKGTTSIPELTAIMKRNPRARFQSASTPEEAERKALDKIQFVKEAESVTKERGEPSPPPRRRGRQSFSAVEASIGAAAVESPKTGELLMAGREIITKQNEKVFERIAKNPRILCTDTETPTILQEGCKYNALHLAAKSNNYEVMKRVLDLSSCVDFIRQIYPKQHEERLMSSCKHLANSYINSPDKMMHQTPLHFACDFNAVECVKLLLSHPFCDATLTNYENQTPFQVIGSRMGKTGPKPDAIRQLFSDRYIVPIWRDLSIDGEAPVMGKVCYIPDLGQEIPQPLLQADFPNFTLSLLEPCKTDLAPNHKKSEECSLRVFANQPSTWKIRAFAGPMSETKAKEFRRVMKRSRGLLTWRNTTGFASQESSFNLSANTSNDRIPVTPPRLTRGETSLQDISNLLSSPTAANRSLFDDFSIFSPLKSAIDLRVRDVEKGLERISLEYCIDLGIPWYEYWPFLGTFCDFTKEEGIDLLEAHFRYLESAKKEEEIESLLTVLSQDEDASEDLNEVIEKFTQLRLNNSGCGTPQRDPDGYCTNPRCKMNSRFCNCAEVVPAIPFNVSDDYSWMYEEIIDIVHGVTPLNNKGMRDHNSIGSTESLEGSAGSQEEFDFQSPLVEKENNLDQFLTAPSSPAEFDVFEDCNSVYVFLSGEDKPGKYDHQVFMLLKEFEENIDSKKHLRTFQWINSMRAHINTLGRRGQDLPNGYTSRNLSPCWEPSFVSTPRRGGQASRQFNEDDENSSF